MMEEALDFDGTELDDPLTAEDVEAALAQRTAEALRSGTVQSAYYNSYAYLRDLQEFALDARDADLKASAAAALDSLDKYHQKLEQIYKWD